MKKPVLPFAPLPPLRPTCAPCPTCGALVQVRTWVMGAKDRPGAWLEELVPLSPVQGQLHQCGREGDE